MEKMSLGSNSDLTYYAITNRVIDWGAAPPERGGEACCTVLRTIPLPRQTINQMDALDAANLEIARLRQQLAIREADAGTHRRVFEELREGYILGEVIRAPDGKVVDWRYVEVNAAWTELVGISRGNAIGHTIREIFPGIEDPWIDEFAQVVDTGTPTKFTRQVGALDRWYDGHAFRLDAQRFCVLFLEVTERRRSDAEVASLNAKLQQQVKDGLSEIDQRWKSSRDILVTLDKQGKVIAVSPVAEDILGLAPAEMIGHNIMEFIVPEDLPLTRDALVHATRDALPITENRYRHKDGGFRWMSWVAAPEGDLIFAAGRHITAEKEAAAALAVTQADRDRIWQLSTDLLLVADFDSRIGDINPAWEQALGWTREHLVGTLVLDLVHPEDEAGARMEVAGLNAGRPLLRYENRLRRQDGSYCTVSWAAMSAGNSIHAIGRDISSEREAKASLEIVEASLRQWQKMEAVGQLTGGLAHDFNNLLTGITGALELMRRRQTLGTLDPANTERYITVALGAANRAAALTHRLLAFARRQTLDPKPTDVNRLIAGMEDLLRRTVGPAIHLEVVGAGGLWPTLVDAGQLDNALLNLCINARDAMPEGGRITIETANRWLDDAAARERDLTAGQYLSLCVSDTGVGMSPEVVARAFEPFYTTKPLGEGTGLGLSMVYGFARQSGGQIRIYSEVDQGTTMCLYLPRYDGDVEPGGSQLASSAIVPLSSKETVLVVEDEPTIQMLIAEVLQELGLATIGVSDGPAALRILQSDNALAMMITDVGLPGGLNGRQVADAARVARPGLKVLFVTGYAENAVIGSGMLDKGMLVLTKPFTVAALVERIRTLTSLR
jgi:PAS domain S-box-containing protein